MRKGLAVIAVSLSLSACTATTDEQYMQCLQGFNDSGSAIRVAAGTAAQVIGAGGVGAAAALVLCDEPEVTASPEVLTVTVSGSLSQPLENRPPVLVSKPIPVAEAPPRSFVFDSRTLDFELNQSALLPGADETLSTVVTFLEAFPEVSVLITGHTCSLGTSEYNLQLSERRAEQVADYLKGQGIDSDRLVVAARGDSEPLSSNLTERGRQLNRRVEVVQL
jgi:outer membrane protein OmpA-like peptidoglycan-associated protein